MLRSFDRKVQPHGRESKQQPKEDFMEALKNFPLRRNWCTV